MRKIGPIYCFLLAFAVSSCEKAPEFPNEPTIAFDKIEFFKNVPDRSGSNQTDVLEISLNFKDGNGDLGLTSAETDSKYREATYFLREFPHNPIVDLSEVSSSKDLLQLGDLDSLPPYKVTGDGLTDCINYTFFYRNEKIDTTTREVTDTVYFQRNENFFNFFVEVYVKEDGEFQYYDFYRQTCIPINGRFTYLNTSEDDRPIEGILTYKFETSNLQNNYFGDKVLKLRLYIKDRALNTSNVVETPEFTLDEIRVN